MPKFSGNLSTMFREHSLIDRPRAAAEAGFRAIKIQFPYKLEYKALAAEISRYALAVSVINVPCGDFIDGGEGNSALPTGLMISAEASCSPRNTRRGLVP